MHLYVKDFGITKTVNTKELWQDLYNLMVISKTKDEDTWKKFLIKHDIRKKTSKAQMDVHYYYNNRTSKYNAVITNGRGTTQFIAEATVDEMVGAIA